MSCLRLVEVVVVLVVWVGAVVSGSKHGVVHFIPHLQKVVSIVN